MDEFVYFFFANFTKIAYSFKKTYCQNFDHDFPRLQLLFKENYPNGSAANLEILQYFNASVLTYLLIKYKLTYFRYVLTTVYYGIPIEDVDDNLKDVKKGKAGISF